MPKQVKVIKNPQYQPKSKADEKVFESLEEMTLPYVQARENVRAMSGKLVFAEEQPEAEAAVRRLEDMGADELKIHMLTLGIKPTKTRMDRSEMVTIIRKRLDEIEVVEDGAE